MIRRVLFLAALLASAPSWSAVTLSQFPPNPGVLPGGGWRFTPGTTFADPTPARAWVNGVYGGVPAAVVTDTFSLKGPAAGALSVAVATSATVPSIAAALARVAARAYGPLSVGMAAYDLLNSSGIRQGASGAEIDPGAAPTPQDVWETALVCKGNFRGTAASPQSSIQSCHTSRSNTDFIPLGCVSSTGYMYPDGKQFSMRCDFRTAQYPNGYEAYNYYSTYKSTKTSCAPITDASSGQSYTPGTYSDGKCITGRYTSAAAGEVIARVTAAVQADPPASAKAAAEAGASIDSSPYSATGPASQIGTPNTTTTTGPTGTTSTTTTPTYNYTYQGDTITVNTTTTTTTNITNNEGGVTTTTKTETKPGTDDEGMCAKYPDSLACMKPGTPPDAETIPIKRKQFSILPDTSRWSPTSGSCTRGAIQLTSGASINLWQPFCDFFGLIRGVVVGMFGLAGAFIFRNGIK